ncbi:condensation domain-containing protein [Acidobacteriota bacterium]
MKTNQHYDKLSIASSQYGKKRNYWLSQLAGELQFITLPYDLKKRPGDVKKETLLFSLDGDIFNRLNSMAGSSDTRLYMILTAALFVMLEKYTGIPDIILGTPIPKQKAAGEFTNTILALRNRLSGNMTFKELILQVRRNLTEAYENANFPINTLLFYLDLAEEENEDNFPLFDMAVLLENIHDSKYLNGINNNITYRFNKTTEEIQLAVDYNSRLYRAETIKRHISHFKNILIKAVFNINNRVKMLDMLSEEKKNRVLNDFNALRVDFPGDKTIHQLFEEKTAKSPDRIALVFESEYITYGELNKRANQMTVFLKHKGIARNKIAAVMLDRSLLMIMSILAIWKAGGAYMPIDPDYPDERIKYMLNDAQVTLLLTDSSVVEKHSFSSLLIPKIRMEETYKTKPRQQILDFDSLPFPNHSLLNYRKYNEYIGQAMVKNSISIQATRGCPYKCVYCHKIWPKRHVTRSADKIFEEVRLYYDMGVRRFAFIDDIFNLDRKNSVRFFELIIEHGLRVQLFFPNGLRGDILTESYIDLMVEAGTVNVALALETASPRLQKLIGKNIKLDRLRDNINYFCKKYPHVLVELFIMLGLPTETEEEAMMTLDFIKALKWIDFPYVEVLKIYPNTDVAAMALKNGIPLKTIEESANLAYHELPETLPFDKSFALKFQTWVLHDYFLLEERLLDVLPYQFRIFTEDEILQKYDTYLPGGAKTISDLEKVFGFRVKDLKLQDTLEKDSYLVPSLSEKLEKHFGANDPEPGALRVLLMDLTQVFSHIDERLSDMLEPPLGLVYLASYLQEQLGSKIHCKVTKSFIDFDNYPELRQMLEQFKPDVIGIRTLTYHKDFFHKTIAMIRHWGWAIPIISGGPYATSSYNTILQDQNLDLVVLGEGEITFCEVVKNIMENGGKVPGEEILNRIDGIAFNRRRFRGMRGGKRDVLMPDVLSDVLAKESGVNPCYVDRSDDLAYVFYTSGSTGEPKGSIIEHIGMMNHIHSKIDTLQLTRSSTIAQNASFTFDISVWQFFSALTLGGRCVIYPRPTILDANLFITRLEKDRVDILEVVPSYLSVLLDSLDLEYGSLDFLRYLIVTGEEVSREIVRRWFEKYPRIKMVNAYGPTEASDDITHFVMDTLPELDEIPIGSQVQNLHIYIAHSDTNICPVGVPGEIWVSGIGVGRGYLNNPEKTGSVFREDPFEQNRGSRLYKTGDLGAWLNDGNIEFLGRKDYQVKIRGFRVELGEIENKLLCSTGIKEAYVMDREDDSGNKYLCAYFRAAETIEKTGLKRFLSMDLPAYMVPASFVQMDTFPLTVNGKVDRKALPEPQIDGEWLYAAPENRLEKKLVEIWADVLGMGKEKVGTNTDFFELGGHSLKATIMVNRIFKEFKIKIPLTEIFKDPTIKGLVEYLESHDVEEETLLKPVEKREYYHLSTSQVRVYLLQQFDLNSTSYNMSHLLVLREKVNKERLEETFRDLIKRHASLRTSFELIDNEPVQKVREEVEFSIEFNKPAEGEVEKVQKLVDGFIRPFDLSQAPLIRVRLIELKEDDNILLFDLHHIISDGMSENIIEQDFFSLFYRRELPGLRIDYKDFAEWQNGGDFQELVKKQEEYWLNSFSGEIPVIDLPIDFPRPHTPYNKGDLYRFELNSASTSGIKKLMSWKDATLFMILIAAYSMMLAKLTGSEDITVGIPVAGRNHSDLDNMIGMFVNTIALRSFPGRNKHFGEYLEEVKESVLRAFENQDFQFEMLLDRLKIVRDLSRTPLFDTVFNMVNTRDFPGDINLEDIEAKESAYKYREFSVKFDMAIYSLELGDTILFHTTYRAGLFKSSTIEYIMGEYIALLEEIAKDCDRPIKEFRIFKKKVLN